jgi:hypothetical protein
VEQIIPSQVHPAPRTSLPILRLPHYLWAVMIVMTGFAIANFGMIMMGQHAPQPSDPFAEYEVIFPGNPVSAMERYPFSCLEHSYYQNPQEARCEFEPPDGMFSGISVLIYREVIIQVTFVVRKNLLRLGDLAAILETNEIQTFPNQVAFVLLGKFVIAQTIAHEGRLSPFLPVWSVSFIDQSNLE